MRPLGRLTRRTASGAAIASLLLATGCAPQSVTPQGAEIGSMYTVVLAIAVIIWAGVVGAIMWAVVRYRKRPDDDGSLPPQTHGNTSFEIIWTAIPTIIVLLLFGLSYNTLRSVDDQKPVSELAAVIEARGYQWSWEFDYGDGVIARADPQQPNSVPRMVVPVGVPVRVELRSDNVLHAFYVPEFLFKRDLVPGQANSFDFTVDVPGIYKGQCAELCGTGHAIMTFEVQAVGRAAFDAWLLEQKQASAAQPCDEPAAEAVTLASEGAELRFDKPCVSVPAGQPVELTYEHRGAGPPHNVAVFTSHPAQGGTLIAQTEVIPSGSDSVSVPAQEAGNYYFFCVVHPQMNGSYTAK